MEFLTQTFYGNTIAVAATTPNGRPYEEGSSRGPEVDVAAPGDEVLSTLPGNSYGYGSGTSMATPQAAGAALLLAGAVNVQARSLPDFTELVEQTGTAVVNISTTQKVQSGMADLPEGMDMPDFPEGSPFGELFKYFFEHGGGDEPESCGSGADSKAARGDRRTDRA